VWDVSQRFLDAIPVPHRVDTTVTVTPPGGTATSLGFYGGTVSVSGSSRIRRTATLSVQGGSAVYDLVSTPGARVQVMHGIRFTTTGTELIPVITGELSGAAHNLGDGTIGIDVADYWQTIDGTDFTVNYQPATATSRVTEITNRITAAVPSATVTNTSTDTGTVGTTQTWTSRSDLIAQLATDGGLEVFFTPDGNAVIRDEAQVTGSPVWAVKPGTGGTLKALTRQRPLDKLYNTVIVTPSSLDGAQTWGVQTVTITDTAHPRHASKIRTRPLRWEARSAMTSGEALAAATILLNRTLGSTETLQLGTVSNPALEAGDVLTITDITDSGRVNVTHIIDGYSLDLVSGDMTLQTRTGTEQI
jgi:Putative phage tail protein